MEACGSMILCDPSTKKEEHYYESDYRIGFAMGQAVCCIY